MQEGMPLSLGLILAAAVLGVFIAAGLVIVAVFSTISVVS